MATSKTQTSKRDLAKRPFKSAITHVGRVKLCIAKSIADTKNYNGHFKSVITGLALAKTNAKKAQMESLAGKVDVFLRRAQALKKAKMTEKTEKDVEKFETDLKDFFVKWPEHLIAEKLKITTK